MIVITLNGLKKNQYGEIFFIPPAFHLIKGKFCGINGRHRAVLLLRHLSIIPILFANPPLNDDRLMKKLIYQPINVNKEIEIPDLPINLALLTANDIPKNNDESHKLLSSNKVNINIIF